MPNSVQLGLQHQDHLLTVPNMRIDVVVSAIPLSLGPDGEDCGPVPLIGAELEHAQKRLEGRDWRLLRERLITLDFANHDELARWLAKSRVISRRSEEHTSELQSLI